MKKKIALLLAAVMVVGSLPMTAFASSDNTVSKIATVENDKPFEATIVMDEFKGVISSELKQTIKLTLTNAEFRAEQFTGSSSTADTKNLEFSDMQEADDFTAYYWNASTNKYQTTAVDENDTVDYYTATVKTKLDGSATKKFLYDGTNFYDVAAQSIEDLATSTKAPGTGSGQLLNGKSTFTTTDAVEIAGSYSGVKFTKLSDTQAMAVFTLNSASDPSAVEVPLFCKSTGDGDANVTIEATDSIVSSQTLKIATVAGGATTATISGTTSIKESATPIKNIVVTETTKGTIEAGEIKLRLTNGFEFTSNPGDVVVFPSNTGKLAVEFKEFENDDKSSAIFTVTGTGSDTASTLSFTGLNVKYTDDAEIGDECEVTISGDGISKQSLLVGTAADFGISYTVEDKDLPTFYAGRYDDDTTSLVVTLKEGISGSWINNRKATIVFPEGIEVMDVNDAKTVKNATGVSYTIDENEVEIQATSNGKDKLELNLEFELSVSPEFTGDITATLTGSAVGDDQEVVVGTAAAPVTVDADVNELMIDYRNTTASDIVLTEADAGVLEKGKTVSLYIDGIKFDGTPSVEVESGDMKIENIKIVDGCLRFDVKTESQKEAAVIRISDIELYMDRSLPAGEYDLMLNAIAQATAGTDGDDHVDGYVASTKDAIITNYAENDKAGAFDIDEVTALEGYVTVVTAGRDQGDETFTTTVSVTIGADKMYAGTKEIALDVPAYISNGYTMMPVRAVTEALSGSAIVRWDDPTDTVTITFGQRVISMTVGSNVMKINGVDVAMQAQCEITDSRAFIPLRDLGYALGLNDSKIGWDDATKTATLN